jgi:hypothetical protein
MATNQLKGKSLANFQNALCSKYSYTSDNGKFPTEQWDNKPTIDKNL